MVLFYKLQYFQGISDIESFEAYLHVFFPIGTDTKRETEKNVSQELNLLKNLKILVQQSVN